MIVDFQLKPINLITHIVLFLIGVYTNFYMVGFTSEHFSLQDKSQENNFRACLHHTLVTHTTVGFGDIYPISPKAKLYNSLHITLVYMLLAGLVSF